MMKMLKIYFVSIFLFVNILFAKETVFQFNEVTSLARLEFFKIDTALKNKVLIVYFHTYKCFYCEKMKSETFADIKVQEKIKKNYTLVSVDYSKYKNKFKNVFDLSATPAIVFFDQNGSILNESFYGYMEANSFYQKLSSIVDNL